MDEMTDKQFKAMMQMLLEMIRSSSTVEEAANKVEETIKKAFTAE